MSRRTSLSIIGMTVIAVLSFVYMINSGLRTGILEKVKTARIEIPDTNGLVVGSRVLLRGIAVGEITAITASAEQIDVAWKYDEGVAIPADSTFRVDNLSALGEPYLSIRPDSASGPYLDDAALVPVSQVEVPTTFEELSERLTNLLTQVEPDKVQEIFRTFDIALPDDPRVYSNLSRAGELMASEISRNSDSFTTLLRTLQPLLLDSDAIPEGLRGATPYAAEFGAGFENVLTDGVHFVVERGPLLSGITNGASPFIADLQQFLDATAGDLHTIGVDLLPGVSAGAQSLRTMDISGLLNNALTATASGDAVTVHIQNPGGR